MATSPTRLLAVEHELSILSAVLPLLSDDTKKRIAARAQSFSSVSKKSSEQALQRSKNAQPAVLVMRPGLPPRPLDPFFFEVIRTP